MVKEYNIALLPGDGTGPEVITEAVNVLSIIEKLSGVKFNYNKALVGGASIDAYGQPLTDDVLNICKQSDAVLLGAIGDFKYDNLDPAIRPEVGLLKLRSGLGNFANLRPIVVYDELVNNSPLKPEKIKGVDIMIVRELLGGVYFGQPRGREIKDGVEKGYNTMVYTAEEVERIARISFEIARGRSKKLCSVDKANVLVVSQLWRAVVENVAKDYPDVELSHLYVDNAAMQLILNPQAYDTIVTSNLFGDILSDEAATLTGSIGMLPSASVGSDGPALYEPVHGSAPTLTGLNKVNPIATILSAAMMLKYSFKMNEEAALIDSSIKMILKEGYRTQDIASTMDKTAIGTKEMGQLICTKILDNANVKC